MIYHGRDCKCMTCSRCWSVGEETPVEQVRTEVGISIMLGRQYSGEPDFNMMLGLLREEEPWVEAHMCFATVYSERVDGEPFFDLFSLYVHQRYIDEHEEGKAAIDELARLSQEMFPEGYPRGEE